MKLLVSVYQKLKNTINRLKSFRISIHREFFYEHNLEALVTIPKPDPGLSIKTLSPSDIALLHHVWPVDLDQVKSRLQDGHSECYLCYSHDELVGYYWVQFQGKHFIRPTNSNVMLHEGDEFMIYHIRVANEYQGRGINKYMLNMILMNYKQKGFSKGLIYTSSQNIANQKGMNKLGFRKYKEYLSLRIGNFFLPLG